MTCDLKKRISEDFGRKLGASVDVRRKLGKSTQDELAGLVDVDAKTVFRSERGFLMPSLKRLRVIADALDVRICDLLAATSVLPSDQAHKITNIMAGFASADQRLLLDFAGLRQKR